MKKAPLYSRSRRPGVPPTLPAADAAAAADPAPATPSRWRRMQQSAGRHERRLWMLGLLLVLALAWFWRSGPPVRAPLTFEQIDHLVRKSIEEKPLASAAARAYDKVIPSVVRVVGYARDDDDEPHGRTKDGKEPPAKPAPTRPEAGSEAAAPKDPELKERGVGTGVVIIDNGTILTNLHVVLGADKIKVTFHDGLESEAKLVSVMAEHDLAVLQARRIPDDLFAATMRGTGDLNPGDRVLAVGFPFGIGPSASEGVVSGLKREFRSPEGDRLLTNLIQFDAAANPGNSGGPLVTMEGEVVGIVTAILNPTKQRVFVGIGFAVPIENAAAGAGMPPF
jgi:S1-C subfamily serine protease